MSNLSRRDFFTFNKKKKIENPEVVIGKIADFPVGKNKLIEEFRLTIESFSEGLRARLNNSNENTFYAIKANQTGELVVNRSENWPAELVFSILTYEPTSFDSSQEDRL